MRLGVIGPLRSKNTSDLVLLAKAARCLVDVAEVDRVIYLGADDAMDQLVASWAGEIVNANPSEDVVFERAAFACVNAPSADVESFVSAERARRRLRVFTTVPPPPGKTLELLDGRIAVFLHDKSTLDEDDIAAASFLVFGKAPQELVHRVGTRVFISPGPLGAPSTDPSGQPTDSSGQTGALGGVLVLDDEGGGGVNLEVLDVEGPVLRRERIEARLAQGVKLRIQGQNSSQ